MTSWHLNAGMTAISSFWLGGVHLFSPFFFSFFLCVCVFDKCIEDKVVSEAAFCLWSSAPCRPPVGPLSDPYQCLIGGAGFVDMLYSQLGF